MIFQQLLGADFEKLHPKLQLRYALPIDKKINAKGLMQKIESGPLLLKPIYSLFTFNRFLFPEKGNQIPFEMTSELVPKSEQQYAIYMTRAFHFPQATRYFNSTTTIDLTTNAVKDFVGEPAFIHTNIQYKVTKDGSLLTTSTKQFAQLFGLSFNIPFVMDGQTIVLESYDDQRKQYVIYAVSSTKLFGTMIAYYGHYNIIY